MKTLILPRWFAGMVLAGGVAALGYAHDGLNSAPVTVPSKPAGETSSPAALTPAAVPAANIGAATQAVAPAPAVPGNTADPAPADALHFSPWVFEVQRLTQAGVDEGVVLSYVANSAGTFNLTADQVIYLKNLGASPQVINAMIRHDQELISGARPLTASSAPPLPPSVQTALAASLHATSDGAAQPASLATPLEPPGDAPIIAADDSLDSAPWVVDDGDYAPQQPKSLGPVRAPYPVQLSDPIIILKLPSFNVPCW